MIPEDARLLSIFVTATSSRHGRRLYEQIVTTARTMDLAGASVFPVELSYGGGRQIHDEYSEYGFIDLPVVVEIVDAPERIGAFLAGLGSMLTEAMVTIESVQVVRYTHGEPHR
jgi:PII-like signaling protein